MPSNHNKTFENQASPTQPHHHAQEMLPWFVGHSFYASLLARWGVVETLNNACYKLELPPNATELLPLHLVAKTLRQLPANEGLKPQEVLGLLTFVLDRLDTEPPIPAYVRSYMCRDGLTRALIQRFSEHLGKPFSSLTDLSHHIGDQVATANELIDAMRFGDPAMGNGLFLATLMNEMMVIKSQLGLLADQAGNPLFAYKVLTQGNELLVMDKKRFDVFDFDPLHPDSLRIQQTLYAEKKKLIEHSLFGVDLNPAAVAVAKLRLWIELLKHACWNDLAPLALPLPAFALRCGDSLVSRCSLQEDLRPVFKRLEFSLTDYKNLDNDYRTALTVQDKEYTRHFLQLIRQQLQAEIDESDRLHDELLKCEREKAALTEPGLFELCEAEAVALQERLSAANLAITNLKQKINEAKNNPLYNQAVEWRYAFPQLLNNSGDFVGFDLLVSNPPDNQQQLHPDARDGYKQLNYRAYKRTGDVSSLFYELGNGLLKTGGFLSYLANNGWMQADSTGKVRQYLMEEASPLLLVDFGEGTKKEDALCSCSILVLQKVRNCYRLKNCLVKADFDAAHECFEDYVDQHATLVGMEAVGSTNPAASFAVMSDVEKEIKTKIEQVGTPLKSWDIQMHTGIKTGYDAAYIVDERTKDEFILADYKNTDILKPFLAGERIGRYSAEQSAEWLIFIPWHFPLLYDKTIQSASERAEQRFLQQYPVVYEHLLKHKDALIARDTAEVGVAFEWYALQRAGSSNGWDDLAQQKIVWQRETRVSNFCLDYSSSAILDATCFITGQHLKYLLGMLNSKLGQYMLRDAPRLPNGDMQISILVLEALKIPVPTIKIESEMTSLVNRRTTDTYLHEVDVLDNKIDQLAYDMYGLTNDERAFIETQISFQ